MVLDMSTSFDEGCRAQNAFAEMVQIGYRIVVETIIYLGRAGAILAGFSYAASAAEAFCDSSAARWGKVRAASHRSTSDSR